MRLVALVLAAAAVAASCAAAGPERRESLSLRVVARGLESPVHVAAPKGEPGRLYVVEQAGRIVVLVDGKRRAAPFLDIRDRVASGGERGLLSVAFHPAYATNRRLYVNYTGLDGHTRVVEYRSNGRRALPASARQLLLVRQPYANHNGGQLAFGPDGRLWVGMGDGGAGGDPENRAQNMRSLLGKLLSIDVRTKGVRIEALGLRNPWRFSFDRANGHLWIADVGQSELEEIDVIRKPVSATLWNLGWDVWEGLSRYEDKPLGPGTLVQPVAQYSHSEGCSVTGGFVYRGAAVKAARGRYFYGDYCSGTVWSMPAAPDRGAVRREPFRVEALSSFGEDARGELYAVSQRGVLYRLAG